MRIEYPKLDPANGFSLCHNLKQKAMKTEHFNWLKYKFACGESIKWIEQNNIQSLEEAWNACERGDWLLWLAQELGIEKRKLVMCGALCAHTVVQYMEDARSRNAVRIAFLWGRGKATDEQLEETRKDAEDAWIDEDAAWAGAAWSAAAADADECAVYAADTADDADDDTWVADDAWSAAAAAAVTCAAWSDDAGAKKANELRTANIARKLLTQEVMNAIRTI